MNSKVSEDMDPHGTNISTLLKYMDPHGTNISTLLKYMDPHGTSNFLNFHHDFLCTASILF